MKCVDIDEGRKGVKVNSISPGYIATPMLTLLNFHCCLILNLEEVRKNKKLANVTSLGRVGEVEEIA